MRWIVERLAEQAFGRRRIAQRRQQEVDSGAHGIDGPVKVTPTALHTNVRLIDPPGFVGRLEMTAQPLFQFGTVTLHPTPDRRVIRLQPALGEQLLDVAERERVPEIPAHGAKNQLRRRLPPLEDCRSGCVLHGLFTLPVIPAKVATHPRLAWALSLRPKPVDLLKAARQREIPSMQPGFHSTSCAPPSATCHWTSRRLSASGAAPCSADLPESGLSRQ